MILLFSLKKEQNNFRFVLLDFLKHIAICILLGIFCGLVGSLFSESIAVVTNIRMSNNCLIFLLPFAGLLSVWIFKKLNLSNISTDSVVESCSLKTSISPLLAPAIFLSSVISHLFGASVGREGAALQIGGGLSATACKVFKLHDEDKEILTFCGMAGVFSAVFGTPITAFIFSLQIVNVWKIRKNAVIPTIITSLTAYFTAFLSGAHAERFEIGNLPKFSYLTLLKVILIALLSGLLSMVFCYSLEFSKSSFKKLFKNPYLRIAFGGVITIILTLLFKTNDYNGAGMNVINRIFENGQLNSFSFILKILFTCVAIGCGFKGGEIVPTLFVGATFGALIASLVGLPIAFGASIGMTALFCGVTKCWLASIFLAIEIFSGKAVIYTVISAVIAYFASGNISLYEAQIKDNIFKFLKKTGN